MFDFTGAGPTQSQGTFNFTTPIPAAASQKKKDRKRPALNVGDLISKGVFESAVPREEPPKFEVSNLAKSELSRPSVLDVLGEAINNSAPMKKLDEHIKQNHLSLDPNNPADLAELQRREGRLAMQPGEAPTPTPGNFERRVARTMRDTALPNTPVSEAPSTGNKYTDIGASLLGTALGFAVPGGAGADSLKAAGMAENTPGLLSEGNNLVRLAKRGTVAGGTYGAAQGLGEGMSPSETSQNALKNAFLFGAMDAGLPILGKAVRTLGKIETPLINKLDLTNSKVWPMESIRRAHSKPIRIGRPSVPENTEQLAPAVNLVAERKPTPAAANWIEPPAAKDKPEINPLDAEAMKALGGWRLYMTDVYRNFKDTFGNQYDKYRADVLDPFDTSKKANIEAQEAWLNKLKAEVVDRLGIKKGSKESALVQDFGEGKLPLVELKQIRPDDWQRIVEADQWFRNAYNQLIDEVNASRRQIYPNVEAEMARIDAKIEEIRKAPRTKEERKEEKIKELLSRKEEVFRNRFVPKRENYYRHFREMAEGFAGLKNIFDSPAQISSSLSGVSDFTLPKSKWASFMQRRGMGSYKSDAVGGFLNYIPAASHAIHIDPHVSKFEKLAENLAEATEETGHLNNFIEWLRDYSRDLAGKTNPLDRTFQKYTGRKVFRVMEWLNNRVKANVVLGNASSALAQVANIPQGIAFAKQYSIPGAGRALKSVLTESQPMKESGFLKERYGGIGGAAYRQFDTGLLQQPKNFAVWMMETADKVGTSFIWNSAYSKALGRKVADPVKYADNITRKLVAGRGVGEVPLVQKSKVFQLVAPFQLEVGNLWSVMRDFTNEKDFGALVTLAISSWMLNRAMEKVRGSGVTFDPIQAIVEATGEDMTPPQRAGRLAGEVLSNIPLGQTFAAGYPEYGKEIFGHKLPTREKFFGSEDPTRFGSGLLAWDAITDPLHKAVLPFGGGQLKKTVGGLSAVSTKGAYTPNGSQLKYPVATDLSNIMKGVIFGPGAFREAQDYYQNNNRPLSEKDTEALRARGNPQGQYGTIQRKRDMDSITQQIKDVQKDKKLTQKERAKKVQELITKRNKLTQGR